MCPYWNPLVTSEIHMQAYEQLRSEWSWTVQGRDSAQSVVSQAASELKNLFWVTKKCLQEIKPSPVDLTQHTMAAMTWMN